MIAIFVACHNNVARVERQLLNYKFFFGSSKDVVHVLHVSQSASSLIGQYRDLAGKFENVIVSEIQYGTSLYCVFGAFKACTETLVLTSLKPDFVVVHTESDLLFKADVNSHILKHKLGFESYSTSFLRDDWYWTKKARNDKIFTKLLQSLSLSLENLNFGRQEGSFFSWEQWLEFIRITSSFYSEDNFFSKAEHHWPIDECIIPTLFNQVLKSQPNVKNYVATKESTDRNNFVRLEDIKIFQNQSEKFGAKWFSDDLSHDLLYLLE